MRMIASVTPERLAAFRRAVAERPASAGAHQNLGTALLQLNRTAEAEQEFRCALAIDPDLPEALVNLGGILLNRWDFQGCLEVNRRAAGHRPDFVMAHYNQGLAQLYLRNAEEMARCFSRVLEVEPGHGGAHYHLAVGLLALDRVEESRFHLDLSVEAGFSPQPEFLKALEKVEGAIVPTIEIDESGKPGSRESKEE
jgi:Flp pilus assembly protein TadD